MRNLAKLPSYLLIVLLFSFFILVYWFPFLSGSSIPRGDAAIPWAIFSYGYHAFQQHGSVFMWNPFNGTGADISSAYMLFGFSLTNPVLWLVLFLGRLTSLSSLSGMYLYIFLNVLLGMLAMHFLAKKFLDFDTRAAIVTSLIWASSGYVMSTLTHPHLTYSVSLFPLALIAVCYIAKFNVSRGWFLLFISLTWILSGSYPSASLITLLFLGILGTPLFISLKTQPLMNYIKKGLVYLPVFIILLLPVFIIVYGYINQSAKYINTPQALFDIAGLAYGSYSSISFSWLLNIFFPFDVLIKWNSPCNDMYWCNQYYYVGVLAAVLLTLGLRNAHQAQTNIIKAIWIGLVLSFTLGLLVFQESSLLFRHHPQINILIKNAFYYRSFILIPLIFLIGLGLDHLFKSPGGRSETKSISRTFLFSVVGTLVVGILIGMSEIGKSIRVLDILAPLIIVQLLAAGSYFLLRNRHPITFAYVLTLLLLFDGYNALTRSIPYNVDMNPSANTSYNALHDRVSQSYIPPEIIQYSFTRVYSGMHYDMGGIQNRQGTAPMPTIHQDKRLWQKVLFNQHQQKSEYEKMFLNGVSTARYLLADSLEPPNIPPRKFSHTLQLGEDELSLISVTPFHANIAEAVFRLRDTLPSGLKCMITENSAIDTLCLSVDVNGKSLYPISGDIFHIQLLSEWKKTGVMRPFYPYLFATYPSKNGIELFVRLPKDVKLQNLRISYDGSGSEKGAVILDTHSYTIPKGSLQPEATINDHIRYITWLPSNIPSYVGQVNGRLMVTASGVPLEPLESPTCSGRGYYSANSIFWYCHPLYESENIPSDIKLDFLDYSPSAIVSGVERITNTPDYRKYIVNIEKMTEFFILKDTWHPFWSVRVDGVTRAIELYDNLSMAIQLDKGKHVVEFQYGRILHLAVFISLALQFLLFCLILVPLIYRKLRSFTPHS